MKKGEINTTEIIQRKGNDYNFTVFRPGGNDTGLVTITGIMPSADERKRINNLLQKAYPNIEQVGFVKLDPALPELMMAGGEFCGNATRSTAWQSLGGMPGEVQIKVSGVDQRLKAGVTTDGEAFAQMPIYPEVSRIKKAGNTGYIVEMEGIVHYVDFDEDATTGLSPDEIKKKAFEKLQATGLNQYPAAGVIYTRTNDTGLQIDPVVYVKAIDTLYYETACGSGATAVGLILASQNKKSIKDIPVFQPSGMAIKVSVNFDGSFQYAQIQGKIEKLNSGNVEITETTGIITERINTLDKLQIALSTGDLISLYQNTFAQPPYYEEFTDEDVRKIFIEYVTKGLLFLTKEESSKIIAFGAALPISSIPELADLLENAGKDIIDGWYMADLGVREDYRRKGRAQKLIKARLNTIPKGSRVIMRTSVNNIASQNLYKSLGFEQIPNVLQEVTQRRTDGSTQKDTRIFLEKIL